MSQPVSSANVSQPTMICTRCWIEQPVSEFRRRRAGAEKRHSACRGCHSKEMRDRSAAKRRKIVYRFAQDINSVRTRKVGVVAQLVEQMLVRFGTLDQLGAECFDAYLTAKAAGTPPRSSA